MRMPITSFKAKCTQIVREVATQPYTVEITNRGKVVAVVSPPTLKTVSLESFWGSLKGSVMYLSADFDEPLGDKEWEVGR